MMFANMHNHSDFSDGPHTPGKLVEIAKAQGHGAVVLTDHDTVNGYSVMVKACQDAGLLTMIGCEFSTVGLGTDFHLLGFDFDPKEPEMEAMLQKSGSQQAKRTKLLFDWAVEKGNIQGITWEEVIARYPYNNYICNEQVFRTLIAKGLRKEEDYDTFVLDFNYGNQEREKMVNEIITIEYPHIADAIRIIKKAGGVPMLAHPGMKVIYLHELIEMGLMGFEVYYPTKYSGCWEILNAIADRYGLYKAGGTDHSDIMGGFGGKPWPQCGASEEDFMKLYRRELG